MNKTSAENKQHKESLAAAATSTIRDRILDLTLKPGSRIDDKVLMQQFSVGRTPIREALNRLTTEGLVNMRRNRGWYVYPLDIDHVKHLVDAYIAAERLVGYFCITDHPKLSDDLQRIQKKYAVVQGNRSYLNITKRNAEFHTRLAVATENDYICDFCTRLYNLARRMSFFIYLRESDSEKNFSRHAVLINRDHDEIIKLIQAGDNDNLIDVLTRHAKMFRDRVMRVIGQTRSENFPV